MMEGSTRNPCLRRPRQKAKVNLQRKGGEEKGNKTLEIACNKAEYISTMLQKRGKRR